MSDALQETAAALGVQASGREASIEEHRRRAEISVGLAESNPQVRTSLRSFLRRKGYEAVTTIRNQVELSTFLAGTLGDLLVLDVTMEDLRVLDTIKQARMGNIARNPYLVIVGTATRNDPEAIKRAIDAGVDDLLIKPLAPATLMERITALVGRRRPFIVTSDYVGPDRRRDPSRVSTIPTFDPPNTLAMKEKGETATLRETHHRIDASVKAMREERIRRFAFQIAFLVRLVVANLGEGTAPAASDKPRLDRALRLCHEAQGLLSGTDFEDQATVWQSMATAVDGLIDHDPAWSLGRVSTQSISLALNFYPDKTVAKINEEVTSAVEGYRARRQRLTEGETRKARKPTETRLDS